MKNKILIFCLAAVLSVVMLGGCGGNKAAVSGELKEDASAKSGVSEEQAPQDEGAEAEAENLADDVIAVVNGEELKSEHIGYYIYNNAVIRMYKIDSDTSADVSAFDWSASGEDGRPLSEIITEAAIDDAINDLVFRQMAEKSGYSVENAEKEATELVKGALDSKGEGDFNTGINMIGIKNMDDYINVYTNISVFEDVAEEFQTNPSKYISDPEVLNDYRGTKGASVQHILILNDTDKGDALAVAEEVEARAKSGEDFLSLMREFNEDTGEKETGYTFPEGEMVKDFEDAAFALEIGEIDGVVKSDYGYHVIKRICGAYELQNYWRQNSEVTVAQNAAELADFNGVISMINDAKAKDLSE